jgi:hypothetical protein
MTHWRKPHYVIETEFGTLRSVTEEDAELAGYELAREPNPIKFTMYRERQRLPGWVYIPGMVFLVSMVIVGLRYLFGG